MWNEILEAAVTRVYPKNIFLLGTSQDIVPHSQILNKA